MKSEQKREQRKREKRTTRRKQHKSLIELGPLPSASFFMRAMWPIAFSPHVKKIRLPFSLKKNLTPL
jgi:hypothetical protein